MAFRKGLFQIKLNALKKIEGKRQMRTIKFRGKRLDNGEWVYGHYADYIHPYCGLPSPSIIYPLPDCGNMIIAVDPSTVGQFTGLMDRHGAEIYEGDIITVNGRYPRVVLWDKMSWALMPCEHYHDEHFWVMNLQHPGIDWWEKFADKMEVVGNIHDNPELLNTESNTNNTRQ